MIAVDQFGIAEGRRFNAEKVAHAPAVGSHLIPELIFREKGRQAVAVGFVQKLNASRGCEFLEAGDHFGRVCLSLVDEGPCERKREAEPSLMFPDQFQQEGIHGQVALVGDLAHDKFVQLGIIVIAACSDVEEAVGAQAAWLVDFKIKAYGWHG